jgi:hypothetical protein
MAAATIVAAVTALRWTRNSPAATAPAIAAAPLGGGNPLTT